MSFVTILPVCNKDIDLMAKNLAWWRELNPHGVQLPAIVSHDTDTNPAKVEQLVAQARDYFADVTIFWYPPAPKTSWPAGPNWAWQNIARYMAAVVNKPWFFLEADVVAVRKRWLSDIADEYARCGKPFMGVIPIGMRHMNGAAVYPAAVMNYAQGPLMTEETAWDVVLGKELEQGYSGLMTNVHPAHTLFQHCWCINPEDGACWNGNGTLPTFKHPRDVIRLVDLSFAVFHRCKDGTLIDMLRLYYKDPSSAMVPQLVQEMPPEVKKPARPGKRMIKNQVKPAAVEPSPAKGPWDESTPILYKGNAQVLVITYAKDFPWLEYALKGFIKYLHGFAGITVLIPHRDQAQAQELDGYAHPLLTWKTFDEKPGKGKLDQMIQECSADIWCPDADIILHLDADCIYHTHITPDEYVLNNKPVMLKRSYKGLYDPANKVWSDCVQWKDVVEKTLRFNTDVYTMCRHPSVHPITLYPEMRRWIAKKQKMKFEDFVLSGRNEFPQTFAEYPTLGAFAWAFHQYEYHWIDIDKEPPPPDRQKTYWSHGGISETIRLEMEGHLK